MSLFGSGLHLQQTFITTVPVRVFISTMRWFVTSLQVRQVCIV
jgi:hypothetical protein